MSEHIQPARNEGKRFMSTPKNSNEWPLKNWFEKSIPQEEGEVGAGMSEQIEPGEEWRFLSVGETIKAGDEFYLAFENKWTDASSVGYIVAKECTHRRRISSKPDVLKIESECGSISLEASPLGPARIIQRWEDEVDEVRLDTPQQIRQIIAWLQQVADWREAQQGETK